LKVRRVGKRMLVVDTDGRLFLESLPEGPAAVMPANLKRPRRSSPSDASAAYVQAGEISRKQRLAAKAEAKNGEAA
jgi:hypothetical protein